MTRVLALLAAGFICSPVPARAGTPVLDGLMALGASTKGPVPPSAGLTSEEAPPQDGTPLEPPTIEWPPVQPVDWPLASRLVARADLAVQLNRHLTPPELLWDFNGEKRFASSALSRTTDPFLAFTHPEDRTAKVIPAKTLHKQPAEVQFGPNSKYTFSLKIRYLDPLSSLVIAKPSAGFGGRSYDVKIKDLQALMRKYSVPVRLSKPHLLLFGNDADGSTGALAASRSVYFVLDAGLDSKGYAIPDEQLPVGQWVRVDLGPERVLLYRPEPNALEVHAP